MKRGETYSSGWLKSQDMLDTGKVNGLDLTIKTVTTSVMDDGKKQRVLEFYEDERELGLNATNWDALAELFSAHDDDGWIGKVANFHPFKLDRPFNGKTHGIRVRAPQGVGPAQVKAATQPFAGATTNGDNWSIDDAIGYAVDAGMTKDAFVTELKAKGLKAWNPVRDTPLARTIIAAHKIEKSAEVPIDDSEIPF